ncbi:MAG TPA: hypothetical protein VHT92_10795 [Candidatus Cybelea sp.]|jgi:hypothetical protein|nr:hypothetical protein [Candidatus Cybelea sp.]
MKKRLYDLYTEFESMGPQLNAFAKHPAPLRAMVLIAAPTFYTLHTSLRLLLNDISDRLFKDHYTAAAVHGLYWAAPDESVNLKPRDDDDEIVQLEAVNQR